MSWQASAVDSLLHQSRTLGLFDKLADVSEPSGLTLPHYHPEQVSPVLVLQHPRAGELWGVCQKHSADRRKRVRLSSTHELESGIGGRRIHQFGMLECAAQGQGRGMIPYDRNANARPIRNGCILAVPHVGSQDRGFNIGFVYKVGHKPTPTERWIFEGRGATGATPIAFERRNTRAEISKILQSRGFVFMAVDVYPSAKYEGTRVKIHDAEFTYPPGPALYAQTGTLILPSFASGRDAEGFSMNILDPLEYRTRMPVQDATVDLTQTLAVHVGGFTAEQPAAFWLWHPIPNDPFLAVAKRERPDLLSSAVAGPPDDEAVALAVEALCSTCGMAALAG
jgi:hypothetical protein